MNARVAMHNQLWGTQTPQKVDPHSFPKSPGELRTLHDQCVKELGALQSAPKPFIPGSFNDQRLKTLKQTAAYLQNVFDDFVKANPGRPLPGLTHDQMAMTKKNNEAFRHALNALDQSAQYSNATAQRPPSSSSQKSGTIGRLTAKFGAKLDKFGRQIKAEVKSLRSSTASSSTSSTSTSSAATSASSATTVSQQSWERYSDHDVAKLTGDEISGMAKKLSYPDHVSVSARGGGYSLNIKANDLLEFLAKNPHGTAAEFGPEYRDKMTGSAGNNDYYGYMLSGGLSNSHELGQAINARLQEMRRVIAEQVDKETGVLGKA